MLGVEWVPRTLARRRSVHKKYQGMPEVPIERHYLNFRNVRGWRRWEPLTIAEIELVRSGPMCSFSRGIKSGFEGVEDSAVLFSA